MCKTKEALKTETLPLTWPCGYICSCFNLFTATTYRPRPLSSVLKALGVKWFYCLISYDLLSNFGPEARTLHISDLEISISLAYVCAISLLTVYFVAFFQLFHLFAGFISQLAQEKPIDECIRCGHYAANYMIQQSGVTMTQLPNFS